MENKKGSGIFLGVVSVATLIVAIIGATFAYFSANMSSNENAINATAYEFNASLSVSQVYPTSAGALVPVDPNGTVSGATAPNNTNLAYALNTAENKCIDSNGYQVCSLYSVVFTNNGSEQLSMSGVIKTISNVASERSGATPFQNLTYSDISGTTGSFALAGTPATLAADANGTVAITDVTVPAKVGETAGTITKYVLIYLNNNGDQSNEMGATYNGQLVYTSTNGNGNQLTGTFSVTD